MEAYDEYERQAERQRNYLSCEHCFCPSGHWQTCKLINREAAESFDAIRDMFVKDSTKSLSVDDIDFLHAVGISL